MINLLELEALAREHLTAMAFDYYVSGARDEVTLRENRAAWERISLHYRVLVDVSRRSTATTVLGLPVRAPILVAPTAFHCLAHPEGELATARAASRRGAIMVLSTLSNTAMEEVVAATSAPVFFQLYVYRDRGATRDLVARARAAGCKALVLTVDAPVLGTRERDVRNAFSLPPGLEVKNLSAAGLEQMPVAEGDSCLSLYARDVFETALTWSDLAWLCEAAGIPVLVKGVVRPDDAARAIDHGAAGVVVSNHGGRQLDTAPPTAEVLPRIVDALDGRGEVLVDGGVRRGTDVVKALAFGARAVLVGRPILWGLAIDGQAGVERVLEMLETELDNAMALCGTPTVADITRDLVRP
jgi:4-hydroxymandelate oxidase